MRGFDGPLPLSDGGKRAGRNQGAPGSAGGKPGGKREPKKDGRSAAVRGQSADNQRTISGQSADDQRTISGRAVALRPQRVKAKASAGAALTLWNLRATTQSRRAKPSQTKK